jgi:hypothetical protein
MIKKILSIILLLVFVMHAQITITQQDLQATLSVGKTFSNYSTDIGTMIDVEIGTASDQSQSWDFSGLTYSLVGTSLSVNPQGTSAISSFPDANIVIQESTVSMSDEYVYSFYQMNSGEYSMLGSDDGYELITHTPPIPALIFPMTYGTTWNYSSQSEYMGITSTNKTTKIVDAFGTMTLPDGVFDVLRIISVDSVTTSYMGVTATNVTCGVNFYTKENVIFTVSSADPDLPNQSTVTANAAIYSKPDQGTDINEKKLASDFRLYQNYPNPFNPETIISFSVPEKSHVLLSVFNILGEHVSTIVNKEVSSGEHSVKFNGGDLPSGTYCYTLNINGRIKSNKMLLLK